MGWTVYNSDGQILQGSSTLADDAVTTAKILDANVTNAKLANMAANTVKVRDANSSGDPSDLAVATTQLIIGDGTGFTAAALSGEATMTNAGVVSVSDNIIDEANLKVSNSPTNGQFLSAQSGNTGGLTWAAAGGKVLQAVTYNKTNSSSMSSSSWTAVPSFAVDITLRDTDSRVLILATDNSLYRNNDNGFLITLNRNAVNLGHATYGLYYGYGNTTGHTFTISYLDSPSIGSTAITYQVYVKVVTSGTLGFVNGGSYATITLLEIGS